VSDTTTGGGALSHREILIVFSGLMAGLLVAALDQTIVATALPTIVGDLGGLNHLSWVVTAYLLTSTVSVPLYGKVSDLLGRKIVFQAAIVIFVAGSMLAGLSQNMLELVLFRALQGVGGGGLISMAQAIIGDIVAPRERGK
jgi:MFS family permease